MRKNLLTAVYALAFMALLPQNAFSQQLLHYWNFNDAGTLETMLAPTQSGVAGAGIAYTVSTEGTQDPKIQSGTGQDFGTLNARLEDAAGAHLRFNDPVGGVIVFSVPTTGYKSPVFSYVTRRSTQSARRQDISFSTNGSDFQFFRSIDIVDVPTLVTLDFSDSSIVYDNANFKIKIEFVQVGGNGAGNNRFDNVALDAVPMAGTVDVNPPVASFNPVNNTVNISTAAKPVVSFNEPVRAANGDAITGSNAGAIFEIRQGSVGGTALTITVNVLDNKTFELVPSGALLNNTQYFVVVKAGSIEDTAGNEIVEESFVTIRTIPVQTAFSAGDILPVAYRMNATNSEDAFAFLTTVDIMEGTMIHFADAKYTDNAQPQCPGGLTWTAPAGGLPAGTVVTIFNDVPSADKGTLTGNGFGLSSGGDQIIAYTGTPAAPNHVMAFSSNAWVTGALTTCSGSNSKQPASLADGQSAVSFATAPGNVSGNSANAYYNGPVTGSFATLRTSIMDPANWVVSASGTDPQTWPNFAFPGPPAVINAWVHNQTTIKVAFNKDMNPASAQTLANYTGISGLSSATLTNNGALADTVTLVWSNNFTVGGTFALTIAGVQDADNVAMFAPYVFNFVYQTKLSLVNEYASVSEGGGVYKLEMKLENPSASSAKLIVKSAPFSTGGINDINLAVSDLVFTAGSASTFSVDITITDDNLNEQDEYIVFELTEATGCEVIGSKYFTLYLRDNDRVAPVATQSIQLNFAGRYTVGNTGGASGLAEIVAYDPISQRLFTMSTGLDAFDIVDFSNPASPTFISRISLSTYGSGVTSVAVKNSTVAVTVPGMNNEQENGKVVFFDTNGVYLNSVTVGALPDMVTFTHDGMAVLTANEGQSSSNYSVDP